jgi:hypothetical protein
MVSYENHTVTELKEIAKKKGLSGYSKLKREELIKMLRSKSKSRSKSPKRSKSRSKSPKKGRSKSPKRSKSRSKSPKRSKSRSKSPKRGCRLGEFKVKGKCIKADYLGGTQELQKSGKWIYYANILYKRDGKIYSNYVRVSQDKYNAESKRSSKKGKEIRHKLFGDEL